MHTRCSSPLLHEFAIASMTCPVENNGQVTLESKLALLELSLAWAQKVQLAVHFPLTYVRRYAVVGFASIVPEISPRWIAEPTETLIVIGRFLSTRSTYRRLSQF